MKKRMLAMLLTGLMAASLAACGSDDSASTTATETTEAADTEESSDTEDTAAETSWTADNVEGALEGVSLSFGTTGLFGPFSYYDSDGSTLIGYDIEIEKALQDLLGFEMEGDTQVMDYSALTTSLAEGKIDIGMAALCATDERKEVMNFSKTYCDSGLSVMINTETSPSDITSVDDLVSGGYTVAVEKGTASHMYTQNNGFDTAKVEVHDTITTAYESLEQGKVDAVIQDGPGARFYISSTEDTKLATVGDEFNQGQSPYAIAISFDLTEEHPDIVEIFDAAIDKLTADGTLEKLLNGESYTAE